MKPQNTLEMNQSHPFSHRHQATSPAVHPPVMGHIDQYYTIIRNDPSVEPNEQEQIKLNPPPPCPWLADTKISMAIASSFSSTSGCRQREQRRGALIEKFPEITSLFLTPFTPLIVIRSGDNVDMPPVLMGVPLCYRYWPNRIAVVNCCSKDTAAAEAQKKLESHLAALHQ